MPLQLNENVCGLKISEELHKFFSVDKDGICLQVRVYENDDFFTGSIATKTYMLYSGLKINSYSKYTYDVTRG